MIDHVERVPPAEHGVEEPAVEVAVGAAGGVFVRGVFRVARPQVQGDADAPALREIAAEEGHGFRMRRHQHVRDADRRREIRLAGGVAPLEVAGEGDDERLVQRDPERDPVSQRSEHGCCVVDEAVGGFWILPAPSVLKCLGKVPVIERDRRGDARVEQLIHEPAVEVQARTVRHAAARGEDARPGDREAVTPEAETLHQPHVVPVPVVVIAGDVAGLPVGDLPGRAAEPVPDRLAAAVLADRTLDLVGSGRRSPHKTFGKTEHVPLPPTGRHPDSCRGSPLRLTLNTRRRFVQRIRSHSSSSCDSPRTGAKPSD